ncbi:MAG TPA: response regulator [Urbifossiella sp.]|nr:response regulator [Urbifossiella sp.]
MLRVLCVDDNHDAADTLGVLLELVGYQTRVCYDGPTALTAAADFRPDAAILDLSMPGMSGDELGRHLRATDWGRTLPLVALTALSGEDARERTTAAGFDLHLVKPVNPDRLANVLADIVILRAEAEQLSGA